MSNGAGTVQQVKERLSIVEVISGYVKLERAGGSLRARCPFHSERTPSFFVSPDRGTYHCFGCQNGGDIFSFVEQIEGLDFKGALKVLAEKAGVPLVYEKKGERDSRERLFELLETITIFYSSRLSDDAKEYITKRGIPGEIISTFRVGLAGSGWSDASEYLKSKGFSEKEIQDAGLAKKGERGLYDRFRSRIIFPINDSAGRVVGFSGRIFGADESSDAPKYLNSPETILFRKSRILYGFDKAKLAIRKYDCAILVEGQVDLLASHAAGWPNTVAVSGTAFTAEHAELIHRMSDNLVLALDADEAGIKAAGRAARAALQAGLNVKVARLPKEKDPADLILSEGADAWKKAIRDAKDIVTFLLDVLHEHLVGSSTDKVKLERFRRSVETAVLPFLADVQSPIQREQYVQEIAARLNVREGAVSEAVANLPRSATNPENAAGTTVRDAKSAVRVADRTRHAYALLLWQESQTKPVIELALYKQEFQEVIGSDAFKILEALPDSEKESMRFASENLYRNSTQLPREAKALLCAIARDKLAVELREASASLKQAEMDGDDVQVEKLVRRCKDLSLRIALLPR